MPKVSIVLPIYNASKYLKECMDSVVNQTLKDIEIICVNDGSKDNSLEILEEYAKNDKRIVIINQENGGMGRAYNAGLDIASGEYIGFVEPDDYIALNMYEELYKKTISNSDIIKGDWYFIKEKNIIRANEYRNFENKTHKNYEINNLWSGNLGHWSAIYKNKDFIQKYNIRFTPSPGASFQDFSFTVKVFALAKNVEIITQPLYFYRLHPEQSIRKGANYIIKNSAKEFKEAFIFCEKNKKIINEETKVFLNIFLFKRFLKKDLLVYKYICAFSKLIKYSFFQESYKKENFTKLENKKYRLINKSALLFYLFEVYNKIHLLILSY